MDSYPSLAERLGKVKHFQNLSMPQIFSIVNSGILHRFKAGETIYNEGDPCAGMCVLIHGCVHLFKTGPQGQVIILSIIEPVIMFNEVAVLDGGCNPLTAVADEDSLIWQIGYTAFQNLVEKIPQVGLSLLKVLASRNRQVLSRYEDLSFRGVVARTAKLLLDITGDGQKPIIRRNCSIEEMAHRIASVPEAISRSLNVIKCQGLVSVTRGEIKVLEPKKLAEIAMLDPERFE